MRQDLPAAAAWRDGADSISSLGVHAPCGAKATASAWRHRGPHLAALLAIVATAATPRAAAAQVLPAPQSAPAQTWPETPFAPQPGAALAYLLAKQKSEPPGPVTGGSLMRAGGIVIAASASVAVATYASYASAESIPDDGKPFQDIIGWFYLAPAAGGLCGLGLFIAGIARGAGDDDGEAPPSGPSVRVDVGLGSASVWGTF